MSLDVAFVDTSGESWDITVRMVCRGNSGSQDSIQAAVGVKLPDV